MRSVRGLPPDHDTQPEVHYADPQRAGSEQAAAGLWRPLSVRRSVLQLLALKNSFNQIQPEAVCLVCGFCTVSDYFRFISFPRFKHISTQLSKLLFPLDAVTVVC